MAISPFKQLYGRVLTLLVLAVVSSSCAFQQKQLTYLENEYAKQVSAIHMDLLPDDIRLMAFSSEVRSNSAIINDTGWTYNVFIVCGSIKSNAKKITRLIAPERFARVHSIYLDMAQYYDLIENSFCQGIRDHNMQAISDGIRYIELARTTGNEAGDAFDAVMCDAGYNSSCTPLQH